MEAPPHLFHSRQVPQPDLFARKRPPALASVLVLVRGWHRDKHPVAPGPHPARYAPLRSAGPDGLPSESPRALLVADGWRPPGTRHEKPHMLAGRCLERARPPARGLAPAAASRAIGPGTPPPLNHLGVSSFGCASAWICSATWNSCDAWLACPRER